MKVHTTNYHNTFIEVAPDCPATSGEVPPLKGNTKTIANLQYELVSSNPYQFTSDDVFFHLYTVRNHIEASKLPKAREMFFSKGQPCFRASPLTKRYGWGIHCNQDGKVALYGCHTLEYRQLLQDKNLNVLKAMRTGK